MRGLKWLALSLALLLAVGAVFAQANWSAYLFNSVTRELVRVGLDGTQTAIPLNLPEGAFLGEADTAFTSDGNTLAYCALDYSQANSVATLNVVDATNGMPLYQQTVGQTLGCWLEYSADNSMLTVGTVNYFGGDPNADVSRPIWELHILDADSGSLMASMSPLDPDATNLGLLNDFAIMPDVRYFDNNQVIFTGVIWGSEGAPIEPAFLWDLNSSALQPFDDWWRWGLSVSGTDVVWLDNDPTLPVGNPGGPIPASNVVRMRDAAGEVVTIYHSPDWILADTEFIEDGQRLALSLLEPFDETNPSESNDLRWIALDRAGNVTELATTTGFSQVASAPGGYVYLYASGPEVGNTMTLEYRVGAQVQTLFTGQSENSGAAWNLIWTTPGTPVGGLPGFMVQ